MLCDTRVAPHLARSCISARDLAFPSASSGISRSLSKTRTPSQLCRLHCAARTSPHCALHKPRRGLCASLCSLASCPPVGASGSSSVREPLSCACVCAPLPISCQAHHFPVGRLLRHRLAAQTRLRRGTMLVMAPSALRALAENELASSRSLSASSRCRRSFSSRASASSAVWAARSTPKSLASV